MFYPGDPVEQRKRELIKKLSGGRGGGGYGAAKQGIGALPGFFGRGLGMGATGLSNAIIHAAPQAQGALAGAGPSAGGPFATGPSGQFSLGGDIQNIGAHPTFNPGSFLPPPPSLIDLHTLLGSYGQQPAPPSGFGTRYF